ncbi:hypothetical protein QAD02_005122 [Eretmocerus hayati]|uniref:Uncharacterized protein n=1 Tax=Eretmocerus hayati TaxID=131215 RepID=A0ACC2NWD5_9HYME|nr:hypothetical protein QAD02_005122 [Eretmocerus hayati]
MMLKSQDTFIRKGLPVCTDSKVLQINLLSDAETMINDVPKGSLISNITSNESCMDRLVYLGDDGFDTKMQLVQLSCKSPIQGNRWNSSISKPKQLAEISSHERVLQLPPYRICCPYGQILDKHGLFCEPGKSRLLFNDTNWDSIPYGDPICPYDSPLIFLVADESKFRHEPGTDGLSIEIPRNMNSLNQTVSINSSNACISINASSNLIRASICMEPSYCNDNVCLRVCCPPLKTNLDCKGSLEEQNLKLFHSVMETNIAETPSKLALDDDQTEHFYPGLLVGMPDCPKYFRSYNDLMNYPDELLGIAMDRQSSCMAFIAIANHNPLADGHSFGYVTCFPQQNDDSR